jgi:type II secretory pathway pseudopilin PulG
LAIIAVLALVLAPSLMSELDRAAVQQEEQALQRLATGLEQHVVRHRAIPDHTTWAAAVAAEAGEAASWVTTNARGVARVLVLDPRFGVGPDGTSQPPFVQTAAGSSAIHHPRFIILSSMGRNLPAAVTNGFAASATQFDELWNLENGHRPASWTWSGAGTDLRLQRVDLTPQFHYVTLNSLDLLPGRYTVDASTPIEVTRSPISFFLLNGSVLGLVGTDNQSQSREVMDRGTSYSFEAGIWRGQIFAGTALTALTGSELEAVATSFLAAPSNPDALPAGSPTTTDQVYKAVQDYMSSYNAWALAGYPESGTLRDAVVQTQATLDATARYLVATAP